MIRYNLTIEQWTDFLNHGRTRQTIKLLPPHPKQQDLINFLFQPDPAHVKQVDLVCGRGFGKSFLAIFIATMALSLSPTEIGLFLEPDWKRVNRVFLKKWRQIVRPELYEINKGEQCIVWLPNGSLLYYGPRNITAGATAMEDGQLGQDTTFIISDEESLKCSYNMYANNLATIREPSQVRFYLTLATPRPGSFKRLVTDKKHVLFRGKSSDNIYLPPNYVEDLRANMGVEQARRELDGEFTALEGRIWPSAIYTQWEADKPETHGNKNAWPNTNRHDTWARFQPGEPWWLCCDLGIANGAYLVVQRSEAVHRGRRLFDGSVWVAVADLCPKVGAEISTVFQRLDAEFGAPVAVTGGADLGTRNSDGKTISYYVQNQWGHLDVPPAIYPVSEQTYEKQIQFNRASYLMCAANGERRMTIARDFVSLDTESNRGFREMIDEDEWPAKDKEREHDVLPKGKDNVVQHIRDAWMMGVVAVFSPPTWAHERNPAA